MDNLIRLGGGFTSRCRQWWFRLRGMRIAGPCRLGAIEVPRHAAHISLAAGVALDDGVTLIVSDATGREPYISIGERCYLNRHTIIDASVGIEIGADVMVGPGCYITDHDHAPGGDGRPASGALVGAAVRIGARSWLGAHVVVLKGVQIGEGAIVGAGAVVTHHVPAGARVAGVPARPLHSR
jgi:acetyltransferase-like isoleucine patch superfamily enzyme